MIVHTYKGDTKEPIDPHRPFSINVPIDPEREALLRNTFRLDILSIEAILDGVDFLEDEAK